MENELENIKQTIEEWNQKARYKICPKCNRIMTIIPRHAIGNGCEAWGLSCVCGFQDVDGTF